MFRSVITTAIGVLASWGVGFVFFLLTANIYKSIFYPGDPDPVYFDIAVAGLGAWLLVGLVGTAWVIWAHVRVRRSVEIRGDAAGRCVQ